MGLAYSAEHAVETLLSGPAASALGGSALTGRENAVVVDIGGTTTDVALIENSAPLLAEGGIRVGKWKTMVKGLFSTCLRSAATARSAGTRTARSASAGPHHPTVRAGRAGAADPARGAARAGARGACAYPAAARVPHPWPRGLAPSPDRGGRPPLCRALEKGPLSLQQAADAVGTDKYQLDTGLLKRRASSCAPG